MPRMLRSRIALLSLAAASGLGASGCQTFIGLEDVNGHLPRLDGDYLIAINRLRADDVTEDEILLRGTAELDPDTRSLDLSLSVLRFDDHTPASETGITDIVFEAGGTEGVFMLNIGIPTEAMSAVPPPDPDDESLAAMVVFEAEDDYSFCARPANGSYPTIGTVLLESSDGPLPTPDADCDVDDE